MTEATAARLLPKYVSHKEVWALKIAEIFPLYFPLYCEGAADPGPEHQVGVRLRFADDSYAPIDLELSYAQRIKQGDDLGYYVRYADGYESWSPTKAFEEGYTRVTP